MKSSARRLTFACIAALLTLLLAVPSTLAQSSGAVTGMGPVAQQEKAIWDALQGSNWDTVATYMAPNFVYVGPESISERAEAIQGMKTCKINSYTFHDAQTRQLSPDIILVTYAATVDTACGPEAYKGDLNCSSVWQRQNGKWIGVAHTETMTAKH